MKLFKLLYQRIEKNPNHSTCIICNSVLTAALQIPTNIAKGFANEGRLSHYLSASRRACLELTTLIILAAELHMMSQEESDAITMRINDLEKMINGFYKIATEYQS